jgi:diamine N-acetyltransferase
MAFNIRDATMQDYESLCELIAEVDDFHVDPLPDRFRRHDGPARERDYIERLIDDANTGLFVADAGGRLDGFALAFILDAPALPIMMPRRYAVIDTLGVRRACRRGGVGRALMERAQAWALSHGAQSVELTVYEFNRGAIAFYQALGYAPLTRRLSKPLQ